MFDEQDQRETIAFLSSPEAFGGAGPVERIDTHVAMLFLCGDRVFKLKRAVRFPYLDFTTLAARRAVCEAELALNRRTAPALYLGVQSIDRQADGRLGWGPGTPVDWVVAMRRFDADCLLATVAARGALTDGIVRDLADHIADFHSRCAIVTGDSGAAHIAAVIAGNSAAMAALAPGLLDAHQCEELTNESRAVFARLAPLLDARAATGHLRHGHGDLHLANICLWQGRPMLFDCLEFDPMLATTDLLYDIAFLLMDLWDRGHHREAALLFNRYLDRSDESGGVAALPLFLSLRAGIRAHVDASRAQRAEDAEERQRLIAAARAYLDLALDVLRPVAPRLVAIGGLSGTGKSTLAALLAPQVGGAPGARWLRTDVIRKRLAGVAPETRLRPADYTRAASEAVYATLFAEARAMLAAGHSVIVDGVFADQGERGHIATLAGECGAAFTGLWLEAPRATLEARIDARRGDASDADVGVLARQLGYVVGEIAPWSRIDAAQPTRDVADRALAVIGGEG